MNSDKANIDPAIEDKAYEFIDNSFRELKMNIQYELNHQIQAENEAEIDAFLDRVHLSLFPRRNYTLDLSIYQIEFNLFSDLKWHEIPWIIEVYLTNRANFPIEKNQVYIQCVHSESDIIVSPLLIYDDIFNKASVKLKMKVLNYDQLIHSEHLKENLDLVLQAKYIDPQTLESVALGNKITFSFNYSQINILIDQLDEWFNIKKRFPLAMIKNEMKKANLNLEICMNRLLTIEETLNIDA